jgi:hypothetical protein
VKKIIALLVMAAVLMGGVVGCGDKDKKTGTGATGGGTGTGTKS